MKLAGSAALPGDILSGDVNGDTFADLITINDFHTFSLLLNLDGGVDPTKAGRFMDQGQFPLGDQGLPAADLPGGGALADLDGDGDLDLVAGLVGDSGPGSLAVLPNSGLGSFGPELHFDLGLNFGAVIARDFDLDGDIDVASAQASAGSVAVLRNQAIVVAAPAVPTLGGWQRGGMIALLLIAGSLATAARRRLDSAPV